MSRTQGRAQRLDRIRPAPHKRWFAIIALGVGLLVAPPRLLAGDDSDRAVDAPRLSNLVIQDCGSCHGLTLRGGLGPPLRPEDLADLPVEAIAAIVSEGVPGSAMPPWKPLLSPEEIRWISEQLKSGALASP